MAYLLSIPDHRLAVQESVSQPDSLSRASADGPGASTTHDEWDPVFLVVRWREVREARDAELAHRRSVLDAERVERDLRLLELRLAGESEERCAAIFELGRSAARARFRSLLDAIVERLGGVDESAAPSTSRVSACMVCGVEPRGRSSRKRRIVVDGRRTTVRIEHQHSLCLGCLEAVETRKADEVRAVRAALRRLRAADLLEARTRAAA